MDWISQNTVCLWEATVPLLQTIFWVLLIGWSIKQFAPELKTLLSRITKVTHKDTAVYLAENLKVSKEKQQETQKQLDQKPESDHTSVDWFNAALIAYTEKKYEEALKNFDHALPLVETEEQAANILYNQGVVWAKLGGFRNAIAVYDKVNRRYGQNSDPGIREQVVHALFNKGVVLGKLDRSEDAIAVYEEIAERYGQDTEPVIKERVAKSLVNKGVALGELGHFGEARADLRKAKIIFTELGLLEDMRKTKNTLQVLEKRKS